MISIGLNVTRLLEKRFKAPSSHTLWEFNVYTVFTYNFSFKISYDRQSRNPATEAAVVMEILVPAWSPLWPPHQPQRFCPRGWTVYSGGISPPASWATASHSQQQSPSSPSGFQSPWQSDTEPAITDTQRLTVGTGNAVKSLREVVIADPKKELQTFLFSFVSVFLSWLF